METVVLLVVSFAVTGHLRSSEESGDFNQIDFIFMFSVPGCFFCVSNSCEHRI